MKRLLKSRLVLSLIALVMLAGAIGVPSSGSIIHSHAAGPNREQHHPGSPPKVTFKTNHATGKSDPVVTIMQQCPATAPIPIAPFNAGDQVNVTATFTSTDDNEANEPEEANNALAIADGFSPVFVKLNQTTSFSFTAKASDQLFSCFLTYDGDEVGTLNITVTPVPIPVPVPTPPPPQTPPVPPLKIHLPSGSTLQQIVCVVTPSAALICAFEGLNSKGKEVVLEVVKQGLEIVIAWAELQFGHISLFFISPDILLQQCESGSALACSVLQQLGPVTT